MQVLNIFHVLVAIALIAFVLVQRGQGATAGAAFGSGASGTVFGARGAGNFLSRSTWVLAGLFCAISLIMAVLVSRIMTEVPEADLGVVKTVQPASAEEPDPTVREQSFSPVDPAPVDVPAFDTAADDVPTIEAAPEQAGDNASPDDLPSAEVVDDSEGSGTDGG